MIKTITITFPINQDINKNLIIEYPTTKKKEAVFLSNCLLDHLNIFCDLLASIDKISFITSTNPKTLYIENILGLKDYLEDKIPAFKEIVIEDVPLTDRETALFLLKILLIDSLLQQGEEVERPEDVATLAGQTSMVLDIIAANYYETPTDYLDYLLTASSKNQSLLFDWFNNRERFHLLNTLMEEQKELIFRDTYLLNHLEELIPSLEQELFKISPSTTDYEIFLQQPLSKEELHSLMQEFLKTIDSSGDWLNRYLEYHNTRIIYKEKDLSDDWSTDLYEGQYMIFAPLTGTITDFRDLVHELAHLPALANLREDEYLPQNLVEFPSIYLEYQAIEFLRTKGYSETVIDALYQERNTWTFANLLEVIPVFKLLKNYNQAPITKETIAKESLSALENITTYQEDDLLLIAYLYPFEDQDITRFCDQENAFLLQAPDNILKMYPYILGRRLALECMQKQETDPAITSKILSIIPTLKEETYDQIITKLNLTNPNNKVLVKKTSSKTSDYD